METLKKVLGTLASIVLWAVILVAALFAFTTLATRDDNTVASIAGYTPMTVASNSMSPTFDAGDLIVIHKCDTSKLKEGDIVTFHTIIENEYALNTHRIDTIQETMGVRSYVTKGDNNVIADTHVISDGDIVGQYVFKLPKFGYVMNFLSSSTGFLVVIILPLLVFFIYQIYHLIMISMSLKRAIALEEAEKLAAIQATATPTVDADDTAAKLAAAQAALEEAQRQKAEAEKLLAEMQKKDQE